MDDLTLRHWTEEDAPALAAAVQTSLEHLRPFMPWAADEPHDAHWRRDWIRKIERERLAGGDEVFGMWLGEAVVGGCGLHRRIGPGGLEIGYWVHVDYTRRGIATAAVHRLCALGFAQPSIGRIEIHNDRANVASARVAAAAGFTWIEDRDEAPLAPADSGVKQVWRLTRA